MSEQSQEIGKLATALAKAQGKITGALKDSSNPFFKSKYADLAACWDACRTQLSDNGLAVIQTTDVVETGVTVVTTLVHESGEWMRGKLAMIPKDISPQAVGSAITYARRYALAGIVGLAQIDDDGNAASGKESEPQPQRGTLTNPRGDAKQNADHKKADMYVTELVKAAALSDAKNVKQLWDELQSDQDTAIVVWDALKKKHGNEFKVINAAIKSKAS